MSLAGVVLDWGRYWWDVAVLGVIVFGGGLALLILIMVGEWRRRKWAFWAALLVHGSIAALAAPVLLVTVPLWLWIELPRSAPGEWLGAVAVFGSFALVFAANAVPFVLLCRARARAWFGLPPLKWLARGRA